jgi:hypothetical protein
MFVSVNAADFILSESSIGEKRKYGIEEFYSFPVS